MNTKLKEFQEAAEAAEQELLASNQPEPEPETEPEPSTETTPEKVEVEAPAVVEEEKYKAAVKAMNEAQRKAAEAAKREDEFNKQKQELEAKLSEALENAKRIAESAKAQPVEEDDLESDMPEVARIAEKKAKRALTPLEQRLNDIEKKLEAERERNLKLEQESRAANLYKEITKAHPDYEEVVASEEMTAWINNEAPPIYKAIFDGAVPMTARDAIAVLNAFKATQVKASPSIENTTLSDADIKAPVKVQPSITTQPKAKPKPTAKEMEWFMHNAHKLSETELAEWESRLTS